MAVVNYFDSFKSKLYDLLTTEFAGNPRIFLEYDPLRYGATDNISLDAREKTLAKRYSGLFIYEYPIDIIVTRRVPERAVADRDLSYYAERIEERLIERTANRNQQSNGLWFDARIDSIDAPEVLDLTVLEEEEEVERLVHVLNVHWVGSLARNITQS